MKNEPAQITAKLPPAFEGLMKPARYKVYYGGRGGAKSWSIAKILVIKAYSQKLRILCGREFQNSIADSVHRLISDQIDELGLKAFFTITQTSIISAIGSQFIFKGLQRSIQEIKSTEGIDIAWIEEAQNTSEQSWKVLIPTIRKEGSEIWVSFNPENESDPTYQRFVLNTPPDTIVQKVNWVDNPHFPETLNRERLYMLSVDPEAYQHVWEGYCRQISDAQILRGKCEITTFEDTPPDGCRLYFGADFGFSQDPSTLVRCWIYDNCLYISHEAYGIGIEIEDMPDFYATVPDSKTWIIKADNSRPETISHIRRKGYNIVAAEKWAGSVEDGIAVLRAFRKIYIHERCKRTAEESRLWSYKVDKQTEEVLPVVVDKHNHIWDAVRYALDGIIKQHNFFDDALILDEPPIYAGAINNG